MEKLFSGGIEDMPQNLKDMISRGSEIILDRDAHDDWKLYKLQGEDNEYIITRQTGKFIQVELYKHSDMVDLQKNIDQQMEFSVCQNNPIEQRWVNNIDFSYNPITALSQTAQDRVKNAVMIDRRTCMDESNFSLYRDKDGYFAIRTEYVTAYSNFGYKKETGEYDYTGKTHNVNVSLHQVNHDVGHYFEVERKQIQHQYLPDALSKLDKTQDKETENVKADTGKDDIEMEM